METPLINRLSALSHPQRMAVFRLLIRRCPDALPAGDISSALQLKPSTASVYLSALTQVGLISQRRDATRIYYSVNLEAAQEMMADLFLDCCRGRPDLCPPSIALLNGKMAQTSNRVYNVLFICTGNSARSIFAETLLRDLGGDRFNAYSAGTAHRSELNPFAVELLKAKGHDITPLRSKNISVFQEPDAPIMDFVFTVCDRAANEECPPWSGQPISGHWGLPDPVKSPGNDAEKRLAFNQAYGALHNRISAFTSLTLDLLDRVSLQQKVDEIGRDRKTQEV